MESVDEIAIIKKHMTNCCKNRSHKAIDKLKWAMEYTFDKINHQ